MYKVFYDINNSADSVVICIFRYINSGRFCGKKMN